MGDVGCKMSPKWVQEGFESEFFVQLGVVMGQDGKMKPYKMSPKGWCTEEPGWCTEEPGTTWVGRRRRRGPLESYRVRLGVRYSCLITAYSIQ